jgi:hypothetical protein
MTKGNDLIRIALEEKRKADQELANRIFRIKQKGEPNDEKNSKE